VTEGVGVASADGGASAGGVAVRERAGCAVSVGDTELVGVGVGLGVLVGGDVVGVGSDEVDGCPAGEGLPAVAGGGGFTNT
jgi:hypothetical protein